MYDTEIKQSNMISITKNNVDYTSPEIVLSELDTVDPNNVEYPILIPLTYRPRGIAGVSFFPSLDFFDPLAGPSSPSFIIGNGSQSLMFVHSVDFTHGGRSAIDKSEMMFDTGAQVTVISTSIAARLGLQLDDVSGTVEIHDASGNVSFEPLFIIDNITIPCFGSTLAFNNVEVVLLDVGSPEGGVLQGIIGMNLFTQFDMLIKGGGLVSASKPFLNLKPIAPPIVGDFAPNGGDGKVDSTDLMFISETWLSSAGDGNYQVACNLSTVGTSATKINMLDWAIFADHWLEGTL